ncbi:MAG TPA: nickel pincer cofactor biosynthesis protein LarB [Longimicrobiaceae bacterium]|nr:nickel pincer cofactor biosynthesis protein LarB [Longimicrobiaceae bacterium]
MTPERLRSLLAGVADGTVSPRDAERSLVWAPVEDIGDARIDHHRALRQGYPEVIFGEGKTAAQILSIAERIAEAGDGFLATRVGVEGARALGDRFPELVLNEIARTAFLAPREPLQRSTRGNILVVAAGTSDLPVAEEAAVTAMAMGNPVARLTDVGVAGLHRLLGASDVLDDAAVVIVVAGMEGALPSVVGGLVAAPVIAVPTSVGYGAALSGMTALLGMLTSCASGITVVNIDNGFGAACAASRINILPS